MTTRHIELDRQDRQEVRRHFGITKSHLSMALSFQRNSLLCQQVRVYAMNRYPYAEIMPRENGNHYL